MKVLLVNPSITPVEVYGRYSAGAPCLPPLGLCYLAAVLLEKGHSAKILDCAAEKIPLAGLGDEIRAFEPDVLGVTATTVSYPAARAVLSAAKAIDPHLPTVLGGAHICALPLPTMDENPGLDIGVIGEGETTLLEIVECLERGAPASEIAGTLVRREGRIVSNPPRQALASLDELPFPARHLLKDLRLYSHTPFRGAKFTTTMITSRGCPLHCGYCDQSVFGREWRPHSPEYVVSEMAHLKERYGVDFVSFEDDNFLLSKKRTAEICERMIGRGLDLSWSCLGHASEVDESVLPLMKKAGCKNVYVGVESGSPRMLALIDKRFGIEATRRGIEKIKKFGIHVTGSFILGLPTETEDEIDRTIDLALSLPLDGVSFFLFTPFPNTPLRELALRHGRVSPSWENYSTHPGHLSFIPDGMDEELLLRKQAEAYRRFLLRPGYLARHLGMFSNRRAVSKGLAFVRSLLKAPRAGKRD